MSDVELDDVEDVEQHDEGASEAEDDADGDSEAASEASQKGKKGAKGKKEPAAKGAKAKAGEKKEKASPKKRKDSGGADGGSSAKKPKAAAFDDPKEEVSQYMIQQNRPYTALVVYENLHQRIKKPALIRILDELTEEGVLQAKDFKKTRVYLAKQHDSNAPDPALLDALAAKETTLRDSLTDQKAQNSKLSDQIRALQNEPSDAELATQLAALRKEVDALNAKLARIKGDGKQVNKEGMNKVQAKFNEACRAWVKRKRAATDMMGEMCGEDGDPKDVAARFGLETDEEAEVKLSDWKDLIKDIKK